MEPYVSAVEAIATAVLNRESFEETDLPVKALLDGHAGAKLREIVPQMARRKRGAFFSNSALRSTALAPLRHRAETMGPVLDPAVGAGDLLIEIARHLPSIEI